MSRRSRSCSEIDANGTMQKNTPLERARAPFPSSRVMFHSVVACSCSWFSPIKGSGVPCRGGVPDGGRRRNFGPSLRPVAGAGADGPASPRKVKGEVLSRLSSNHLAWRASRRASRPQLHTRLHSHVRDTESKFGLPDAVGCRPPVLVSKYT